MHRELFYKNTYIYMQYTNVNTKTKITQPSKLPDQFDLARIDGAFCLFVRIINAMKVICY